MTKEENRKSMEAWWNGLKQKGMFRDYSSYSDWEIRHGRNPDEEIEKEITKAEKEYKDGKAVDLKDVLEKELKDPEFKKEYDKIDPVSSKMEPTVAENETVEKEKKFSESLSGKERDEYFACFGKD
jgi:D-alanyl-D-alanine dipeptidase